MGYAAIVGTKQTIELADFCLAGDTPDGSGSSTVSRFRVYRRHGLSQYDMLPVKEVSDEEIGYGANQEVRMWEKFAELCRSKDTEQLQFYADVALNTQRVMDAVMASVAKGGTSVALSPTIKASDM